MASTRAAAHLTISGAVQIAPTTLELQIDREGEPDTLTLVVLWDDVRGTAQAMLAALARNATHGLAARQ